MQPGRLDPGPGASRALGLPADLGGRLERLERRGVVAGLDGLLHVREAALAEVERVPAEPWEVLLLEPLAALGEAPVVAFGGRGRRHSPDGDSEGGGDGD